MSEGAVVVALDPSDLPRMVAVAGSLADRVEIDIPDADRMLATVRTESVDDAHALVRELRGAGLSAIVGPATPGQRVGWDRRNAPTWFTDHACVCFPWSSFDRAAATTIIEIDPAGGFGAGNHPTTLLVLQQLAQGCTGRVLDVGCGSGVLSMGAVLFGADHVAAIDIAAASVAATTANAARNGVGDRVTASDTAIADVAGGTSFDTIVANIHAPILSGMADDFRRLLSPAGTLILSGLSRAQESLLGAALRPLQIVERTERDDWVALVLRYPQAQMPQN